MTHFSPPHLQDILYILVYISTLLLILTTIPITLLSFSFLPSQTKPTCTFTMSVPPKFAGLKLSDTSLEESKHTLEFCKLIDSFTGRVDHELTAWRSRLRVPRQFFSVSRVIFTDLILTWLLLVLGQAFQNILCDETHDCPAV